MRFSIPQCTASGLQKDDEEEAELWRGKLLVFRNLYCSSARSFPIRIPISKGSILFSGTCQQSCRSGNSGPRYNFDDDVQTGILPLAKD